MRRLLKAILEKEVWGPIPPGWRTTRRSSCSRPRSKVPNRPDSPALEVRCAALTSEEPLHETREWPRSLDGALALDFDTAISGHGKPTTKDDLPKYRDSLTAL